MSGPLAGSAAERSSLRWRVPDGTEPAVRRITAEILRAVTRRDPAEGPRDLPHLLAGGEIGADTGPAALIWGGGLAGPGAAVPGSTPDRVLAVRGLLTADRMVAAGVRLRDIPIGDPGLLVSRVVDPAIARNGRSVAVVPSMPNRRHPFFARLAGSREVQVVDLGRDSLEPLEQIAAAELVVAEDLHGLVYAEAFGKPSVWVATRSDEEHDFHFRDWFSTVFEKPDRPELLGGTLDRLVANARPARFGRSVAALADAVVTGVLAG